MVEFAHTVLRRIIGKLMMQVEEEKRRRDEAIQSVICGNGRRVFDISPPRVPTEQEIDDKIKELS